MKENGFLIIKSNKDKQKPAQRGKQTGRQAVNHRTGNMKHTRLKTTDQHRTTEQLKQRLGNKMGGDRQLTREHMEPTTNNKPCAQHTDTSGGRSGHTIRTVKQPPLKERITGAPHTRTEKCLGGWAGGRSGVGMVGQARGVEVGPEE